MVVTFIVVIMMIMTVSFDKASNGDLIISGHDTSIVVADTINSICYFTVA